MKITRAQIRKFLSEEVEAMTYKIPSGPTDEIISHDHPSEAKLHQDAWAGGQNLHSQEEHQLQMGSKEKAVRGVEHYKIAENYLSRKALRNIIEDVVTEATVDYGRDARRGVDPNALERLTNIMVIGTLATHNVDIDQNDEAGKKVMAEFDDILREALSAYPECANRLASHVMEFVRDAEEEADYQSFMSKQSVPAMSRNEIMDIIIDMFRNTSPGELSKQEYDQVIEDVIHEYGFISAADLFEMNITYDEVMRKVNEIENEGMPTDRP